MKAVTVLNAITVTVIFLITVFLYGRYGYYGYRISKLSLMSLPPHVLTPTVQLLPNIKNVYAIVAGGLQW